MDEFIDFEEFIDINNIFLCMKKINRGTKNISEETRADILDQMCAVEDENKITDNDGVKIETVSADSTEDVINLDVFEGIFNEMQMSTNALDELGHKEFSINELVEAGLDETANKDGISADFLQNIDEASAGIVSNLDEFEHIFNEICVSKDNMNKTEKDDSMLTDNSDNNIEMNQKKDTPPCFYDGTTTIIDKNSDNVYDNKIRETIFNYEKGETRNELIHHVRFETYSQYEITTAPLKQEAIATLTINNSECKYNIKDPEAIKVEVNSTTNNFVTTSDDIISISSTDSDDDGYNSSDFEFISESEAKKKCLTNTLQNSTSYWHKSDYMKYHKYRYLPCKTMNSRSNRQSHIIPEGESYLDLFRGIYAPALNNLAYASNKQVLPATSMTIQTDGFGFNLFENKCEDDYEYKTDADESLKKIRFLYPEENRKRRRL